MTVEDPIAVLSELAEEVMRRLGADFEVTVKVDYKEFTLVLTITVEEPKHSLRRMPVTPLFTVEPFQNSIDGCQVQKAPCSDEGEAEESDSR